MSGMKRHIGKIVNTDQRCVVVFMQIPGREDHALVVGTDNLPDRIEQALMQALESPEGQSPQPLGLVLGRRLLPETGKTIMETLHDLRLLHPIPVDNMVMLPMPNMPFPLRKLIEDMGGSVPNAQTQQTPVAPVQAQEKFNPYGQTQQIEATSQNKGIAANLLIEAQDLEAIANSKREQAYRFDPSLRPQTIAVAAPEVTTIAITDTTVELKAKPKKTRAKKATAE